MSHAEEKEYRIFAGAFIQSDLAARIQAIRTHYDPVTAQITPPHVTLAGTYWRSGSPTAENETETMRKMEIIQGILPPFDLLLSGIRTFPGDRPVVYLGVQVNQGLIEARNLLLSMIGPDKHREFTPHLTLAMRLPWDKAWAMVRELHDTDWNKKVFPALINALQLMQRGPQDKAWRCIFTLKL